MEVEEQEVAADGVMQVVAATLTIATPPAAPTPADTLHLPTVVADDTSLNSGSARAATTATLHDSIEEDAYLESQEMVLPRGTDAEPVPVANAINNVAEGDRVESIEMLVVEREEEIDDEVHNADDDDPLDMSSEPENDDNDPAENVEEQEEEEQDIMDDNGDVINNMYRVLYEDEEAEPAADLAQLRSQVNAVRAEVRDRFHFPHHNQQLLQLRRALLRIGWGAGGDNPREQIAENATQDRAEDVEPENPIRFDTNLPAEHSYLGANMNRVSGVEYLDVGKEYNMMLFLHHHIVYPGEVLPFMISGSIIDADIDANNGLLFGVCFPFMRSKDNKNAIYGVTCQIYEKGTDARGNTLIKSRALQRFMTSNDTLTEHLEYINDNPRLKHGFVRIQPEIYLREPLQCIDMGSMNRFRGNVSMQREYQCYQAATTAWPVHVYNYYNISSIVEKARLSLADHKIDTMPTDHIQLSFWLARNLHLSEEMMKNIFMNDTVNLRMKLISSTFKEEAIFVCRICGHRIANCRELFAMSKHGVQTQYCNSAGYIHETNTVYELLHDAISYSGEPSSEFSWFPGYQWHIIVCKVCTRHIGWEFKACEPNLVPKSFFGISSSSVRISDSNLEPTNPREEIFRNFMRLSRREVQ